MGVVLVVDWSQELGLDWTGVLLVVVAGVGIYVTAVVYARLAGPRSIGTFSTFDFAMTVAMGAVIGRVVLVRTTLLAGVVGLAVLFLAERVFEVLRRRTGWVAAVDPRPVLLVAGGRVLEGNLHRTHLSFGELAEAARLKGLGTVREAAAIVLERNGAISVVRTGETLDRRAFDGIVGQEELFGDGRHD